MNEVTIGKTDRFSWGKRNTEIIKILRFGAIATHSSQDSIK